MPISILRLSPPVLPRAGWQTLATALCLAFGLPAAQAQSGLEVTQLSLEDLMKIEVTTVSRKAQRLADTAAAAAVLTADDIQRSGATSLPEVLRLVPGLDVARIGSSRWAVSARGFNSRFANKLLVLIDGRSVYSPLFSGVFWEAEDVLLEDIDRIEVIRGPGAALWGANAVNGIINIVTRSARRTQGTLATALAGDEERAQLGLRHGRLLDEDTALRVWAKAGERREMLDTQGQRSGADWTLARAGFRLDREAAGGARLTVTGGWHQGRSGETLIAPQLVPPYARLDANEQRNQGGHLLGRYEWTLANGAPATLQAYLDQGEVDMVGLLRERRTTVDLDFQSQLSLAGGHELIWGAGYRHSGDHLQSQGGIFQLAPQRRQFTLASAFVHDELTLVPDTWKLMAGVKLEHNRYTGFELQPNLRALWTPSSTQTLWAALSRAVRTPSRAERDAAVNLFVAPPGTSGNPGPLPVLAHVLPNDGLGPEAVVSAELGYRSQLGARLSLDVAAFASRYRHLRSGRSIGQVLVLDGPVPYIRYDSTTSNSLAADTHGIELALDWHVSPQWRLQGSYSHLQVTATRNGDPANDRPAQQAEGSSPRHQWALRASLDLTPRQQFDLRLKRVSERAVASLPAYTEMDLRYAWRPTPQLELSLVGQNLLGAHVESDSVPLPSQLLQVPRGGYLKARWQF